MANKLAGQRAKFSRARAMFYASSEDAQRQRAIELMAEVLAEAPANDFTIDEVTQGEDIPDHVHLHLDRLSVHPTISDDDPAAQVAELQSTVDINDLIKLGDGNESVYAYGYRCAPDRLKIGMCTGDVLARVAAQISTGTPDKPRLLFHYRTHDCRALERTLHGYFRLRGRRIEGAGAEWFLITREELIEACEKIVE